MYFANSLLSRQLSCAELDRFNANLYLSLVFGFGLLVVVDCLLFTDFYAIDNRLHGQGQIVVVALLFGKAGKIGQLGVGDKVAGGQALNKLLNQQVFFNCFDKGCAGEALIANHVLEHFPIKAAIGLKAGSSQNQLAD